MVLSSPSLSVDPGAGGLRASFAKSQGEVFSQAERKERLNTFNCILE